MNGKRCLLFIIGTFLSFGIYAQNKKQSFSINCGNSNSSKQIPIEAFMGEMSPLYKAGDKLEYNLYYLDKLGHLIKAYKLQYKIIQTDNLSGKVKVNYTLTQPKLEKEISKGVVSFLENDQNIKMTLPEIPNIDWLNLTVEPSFNFLIAVLSISGNSNTQLNGDLEYEVPINKKISNQFVDSVTVVQSPIYKKIDCKLEDSKDQLSCVQGEVEYKSSLGTIRNEYLVEEEKYGFVQFHYFFPDKEELIISLDKKTK